MNKYFDLENVSDLDKKGIVWREIFSKKSKIHSNKNKVISLFEYGNKLNLSHIQVGLFRKYNKSLPRKTISVILCSLCAEKRLIREKEGKISYWKLLNNEEIDKTLEERN